MNPASERMLQHFRFDHLPEPLRAISQSCAMLAEAMAMQLDSENPLVGAEVTTGLRKLLESKDCFVRARLHLPERPTT
jgi:hypothetical protein